MSRGSPQVWRGIAGMLCALLIQACVSQPGDTKSGTPTPSQAAQEAAKRAELRYRAKTHTDLASAYYERKQFVIALEEIDHALQIDPDYVGAWNLRGLVYMALREDRSADESFQKGLRVAPNDSELANNYGYFLCSRGREREGLNRLEAVIRDPLYQTPEKPLVNAGLCQLALHDETAAEAYLRRAVRADPTNVQGAYVLAGLVDRKGHPGEAREILRPLLRRDDPPQEVLVLMVDLDRRLEDREQQRVHSELLQKLYPQPAARPGAVEEGRP